MKSQSRRSSAGDVLVVEEVVVIIILVLPKINEEGDSIWRALMTR